MIVPVLTGPAGFKDTGGRGESRRKEEWERSWQSLLWALLSVAYGYFQQEGPSFLCGQGAHQ